MRWMLDGNFRAGQPGRGAAAEDVLVRARPLVRLRVQGLRAEVRSARHERLEERGILERRGEHLGDERAVEMEQMRARCAVELDRPGDSVEAGRARERPRPARDAPDTRLAERLERDPPVDRELA